MGSLIELPFFPEAKEVEARLGRTPRRQAVYPESISLTFTDKKVIF